MRMVFEPRIVEDIRMPFTFSSQSILRKRAAGFKEIPVGANWHENIEILYFTEGDGKVCIDTEEFRVNAGDIIVVNSNLIHQISIHTKVKYYYLIPDKDFLEDNEIFLADLCFVTKITDKKAEEYYKAIIDASASLGDFKIPLTRAAVLSLVSYLGQNYTIQKQNNSTAKYNEYIKKTIDYIERNISENFTVESLSVMVGISKYHFMREFKRITNHSVVEYINMRRCNRAQIMLKDKDISITEICDKCGFESTSYFSRVFKKYIGVSPKQFRTLIKNPKE